MLSRETVFVVGAGASCELGLPSGDNLKTSIVDTFATTDKGFGTRFIDPAVQNAAEQLTSRAYPHFQGAVHDDVFEAATTISGALPFAQSIDNYLDSQRDNSIITTVGKIGIARAILRAEQQSSLAPKLRPTQRLQDIGKGTTFPNKVSSSWHLRLTQLITASKPASELTTVFDNTAFVVFNYDRCLEHFLAGSLRKYYNADDVAVKEAMSKCKIIHPYGQVGGLPWQQASVTVNFGASGEGRLLAIADDIRTFTESVASGVVQSVKETIETAQTLVILGFGVLPQNVELLTVLKQSEAGRVFLTTKGISDDDVDIVEDEVSAMLKKDEASSLRPGHVYNSRFPGSNSTWDKYVERGTCLDLMNNNWLRLTRR